MASNVHMSLSSATADHCFAAVDMGTNSFKLTLIGTHPTSHRFLTLDSLKEPVRLGLETTTTISAASLSRAVEALEKFRPYIGRLSSDHVRLVATSAVREASNKSQFTAAAEEALEGLEVEVLSGEEEARLAYLGVIQFCPVFDKTALVIDIGGGSTEFAVGLRGDVMFCTSLRLGHVTLTQKFGGDVVGMREYIKREIVESGLVRNIKEFEVETVIGSSGTVKAVEKAVSRGYYSSSIREVNVFEGFGEREWKFNREDLRVLVGSLLGEDWKAERRVGFFKGRAEFILAGSILLEEIFEVLGIEEMEVSGYALGEGVVTEMMGRVYEGFDLNANARWRSVNRLASRFNGKRKMRDAVMCATLARKIFEGLRNVDCGFSVTFDDRDLEYLDAACFLHNIGLFAGKKGYHKQSYHIIMNGGHLHGYEKDETKLIALLVRYHRKKFPKSSVLDGCSKEANQKFRILCTIIRMAFAVLQYIPDNFQFAEFTHSAEGFKLLLGEGGARNQSIDSMHLLSWDFISAALRKELEHFKMVFKEELFILVPSSFVDPRTQNANATGELWT